MPDVEPLDGLGACMLIDIINAFYQAVTATYKNFWFAVPA